MSMLSKIEESNHGDHVLHLYKCELIDGKLYRRGKRFSLDIKEAAAKFAPSHEPRARSNVLQARRGDYLGMLSEGKAYRNFRIVPPTDNGDIRWLLKKNPHLETTISEIYLVDEVTIVRNAVDLPSTGGSGASNE